MQEKIYLNNEIEKFTAKIRRGENFAFLRFDDAERLLMNDTEFAFLRDALNLEGENVYYGIPCACCNRENYYWYISRIRNKKNVTFENIFTSNFPQIKRDAVIITNETEKNDGFASLNVLKYFFADDCTNMGGLIERVINDLGHVKNILFVISAGAVSAAITAELYRNNPENCYIDFVPSTDIHGHDTKRDCWIFSPESTRFDVSVVLSAYKKPEALSEQIEAVKNQTLRPREIFLFQDGINGDYEIRFRPEIISQFTGTFTSPSNVGVWERFRYAMKAASEYVCIFDDDTIPGKRWLENCHFNAQLEDGIYGTIGIIVRDPDNYPKKCWRTGWRRPYAKTARVDFVGHSWFLRREYLGFMFDGTEKYQRFKTAGEDMCLSFKALENGVKTFVPPHPYNDTDLWGSLPECGMKYGNDRNAVSMNDSNINAMSEMMRVFSSDGWKFCINEPESHSLRVYLGSKLGYYMRKLLGL